MDYTLHLLRHQKSTQHMRINLPCTPPQGLKTESSCHRSLHIEMNFIFCPHSTPMKCFFIIMPAAEGLLLTVDLWSVSQLGFPVLFWYFRRFWRFVMYCFHVIFYASKIYPCRKCAWTTVTEKRKESQRIVRLSEMKVLLFVFQDVE